MTLKRYARRAPAAAALTAGLALAVWGWPLFRAKADVTRATTIQWDLPTENADGTPLTDLEGTWIVLALPAADLPAGDPALHREFVPAPGTQLPDPSAYVQAIADGSYHIWGACQDTSGNVSEWAGPLPVRVVSGEFRPEDQTPPGRPAVRINIIVDIEVQ